MQKTPTPNTLPQKIPKYLNERQVSEFFGIALQTLRNDRSTKRRLSYIKIGRSVRYLLDDVVAFVEYRGHREGMPF